MTIDTHSHLNFNAYKEDADEVVKRSLRDGVWMVNVGSTYETSLRAIKIAERYDKGVYAAVGLHPIHLAEGIFKAKLDKEEVSFQTKEEDFDYEKYKKLTESGKVIAIGEIGLDYYYRPKTSKKLNEYKNRQKEVLIKQLDLAEELNLPVIFHCRAAHQDLIEILKNQNGRIKGVIHCFTGNAAEMQEYLSMGFFLGLNGIIFKLDLTEVVKKAPLDRILIETDCPYLTPEPMTGRNEPLYVKYVAEKIAEIKKLSCQEIINVTFNNAVKLFNLNGQIQS